MHSVSSLRCSTQPRSDKAYGAAMVEALGHTGCSQSPVGPCSRMQAQSGRHLMLSVLARQLADGGA